MICSFASRGQHPTLARAPSVAHALRAGASVHRSTRQPLITCHAECSSDIAALTASRAIASCRPGWRVGASLTGPRRFRAAGLAVSGLLVAAASTAAANAMDGDQGTGAQAPKVTRLGWAGQSRTTTTGPPRLTVRGRMPRRWHCSQPRGASSAGAPKRPSPAAQSRTSKSTSLASPRSGRSSRASQASGPCRRQVMPVQSI